MSRADRGLHRPPRARTQAGELDGAPRVAVPTHAHAGEQAAPRRLGARWFDLLVKSVHGRVGDLGGGLSDAATP
jgi:hypothetical protein